MYEFALPEPAKFFIDSYLTEEVDTLESNLISPKKPKHPTDLFNNFQDAGNLNNTNYLEIASEYNAEIEPLHSQIFIGKSFSFTTPETNNQEVDEVSAESSEITIPEG